jgi:hypothetical protein
MDLLIRNDGAAPIRNEIGHIMRKCICSEPDQIRFANP